MSRFRLSACTFLLLCLLRPVAAQETTPSPVPVAPEWSELKAAYDYKSDPTLKVTVEEREDSEFQLQHISFSNGKNQTVPGLFLRPKAKGVYPCVLLLHGLTSNKETMTNLFGKALAKRGIASLALDADMHGERKPAENKAPIANMAFVNIVRGGIVDYRLALDYLRTRKDVDYRHIGLLGYSMGAMMGSILSGVDTRIQGTVLCVGGDMTRSRIGSLPPGIRPLLASASPSFYVGHISPRPVFFLNGKQDTTVPEPAAKLLHDNAKEPKEILWAEAKHILPPEVALKGVEWLTKKLKKS